MKSPKNTHGVVIYFNGIGKPDPLITPHECYLSLSTKPETIRFAYRELFKVPLLEHDIHEIRESLSSNHLLGGSHFKECVEARLGYNIGGRKRGRPTKQLTNT